MYWFEWLLIGLLSCLLIVIPIWVFWHRSKLIKTEVHLSGNKILRKCTDEKFIEQIDQEMLKRGFKFVSYSKRYDWSWLTNEVSIIYEKIPS